MATILGVRVDTITPEDLKTRLREFLHSDHLNKIFTPNAEMLLAAHRDQGFKECLNRGDLNLADGVSLTFVNRSLHRTPGVDVLEILCRLSAEEGKRVLFFGADPGVAESAAKVMRGGYEGLQIQGVDPGKIEVSTTPNPSLKRRGDEFRPDVLAVALGHGKQEHFICSIEGQIPSVRIAIGVGGAFDYISGNVHRAPLWMRKAGFEWLYRLIQQPRRLGRILNAVVVFPIVVIWDKLRSQPPLTPPSPTTP